MTKTIYSDEAFTTYGRMTNQSPGVDNNEPRAARRSAIVAHFVELESNRWITITMIMIPGAPGLV